MRQEGDSLKVVSIGEGETKTNIDGGITRHNLNFNPTGSRVFQRGTS